jgi:hypothetical protein
MKLPYNITTDQGAAETAKRFTAAAHAGDEPTAAECCTEAGWDTTNASARSLFKQTVRKGFTLTPLLVGVIVNNRANVRCLLEPKKEGALIQHLWMLFELVEGVWLLAGCVKERPAMTLFLRGELDMPMTIHTLPTTAALEMFAVKNTQGHISTHVLAGRGAIYGQNKQGKKSWLIVQIEGRTIIPIAEKSVLSVEGLIHDLEIPWPLAGNSHKLTTTGVINA